MKPNKRVAEHFQIVRNNYSCERINFAKIGKICSDSQKEDVSAANYFSVTWSYRNHNDFVLKKHVLLNIFAETVTFDQLSVPLLNTIINSFPKNKTIKPTQTFEE